jgi:hypothetical protein
MKKNKNVLIKTWIDIRNENTYIVNEFNKNVNEMKNFTVEYNYASKWFGSVWFLSSWNQIDVDLIFCRIDFDSIRSDLSFYWFEICKKSTYEDVEMHS